MASTVISAKDVSELRARTGAGMMDCKKALEEAGGDMDKASEILRKKGIAKAEKRAGRVASQGLVTVEIAADHASGGMVELNCETDFVARNEDFRKLARDLAVHVAAHAPLGVFTVADETDALLQQPFQGKTVSEVVKLASGTIGEAVAVKRYARFAQKGGTVAHYMHHNEQVGVLVDLIGATGEAAVVLARDIALHIASADPMGVTSADIPTELIERERRIAEEQVAQEGKPENIRAKIVEGKLKKFSAERSLVDQPFIKDETKTIGELLKALPGGMVARFARFKVGEVV